MNSRSILSVPILRHQKKIKGTMLKNLVNNCELDVEAVYGSARDVSIYQSLRLDPAKIFIISKPSRRLASKCKVSPSQTQPNH